MLIKKKKIKREEVEEKRLETVAETHNQESTFESNGNRCIFYDDAKARAAIFSFISFQQRCRIIGLDHRLEIRSLMQFYSVPRTENRRIAVKMYISY